MLPIIAPGVIFSNINKPFRDIFLLSVDIGKYQ